MRRYSYHPDDLRLPRLELIESWVNQLEQHPDGEITRPQVAVTLRAFLSHEPEEARV